MGAVGYRFRAEARRRWRAWAALALLVAGFGGATLAGIAGAVRTGSAYQRLIRTHAAADAFVEDFIPNPDAATVTHAQVATTAGVAEAELVHSYAFQTLSFRGSSPTATAAAMTAAGLGSIELVATDDGRAFGRGLDQPKLLQGRLPDPANASEVALDFTFPHAGPGTRVTVDLEPSQGGNPHAVDDRADPLRVTFTVVGVVAVPGQFPPQNPNNYIGGAAIYATPAFAQAHRSDIASLDFDLVRRAPSVAATTLENNLQTLSTSTAEVPVNEEDAQAAEVIRSTHLESLALWILAGLVGLVGVLVLGHVLARAAALEGSDAPALRALGMSRTQAFAVGLARTASVAAAGGILAALAAYLASSLAPIGLARAAEPTPGLAWDWAVLGLGAVGVEVAICLLGAAPLWRATSPLAGRGQPRSSSVVAWLAGIGAPATATSGVWMALERGQGQRAVPVRSTLAGAAIGLAALAAALTVGASLTHLLRSPALYGVTWQGDILNNNGPDGVPAAVPVVLADPDVLSAAYRYAGLTVQLRRSFVTEGDIFIPVKGHLGPAIVEGREPGDGEIALGSRTMDQLHLRVGDRVDGLAENENAASVPLSVVGRVVLPPGNYLGRLGTGAVVNDATLKAMAGVDTQGFQLRRPYIISVAFRAGVDPQAATGRLTAALAAADPAFFIQPPPQPNDLVNFGRIQNLPLALAAILALMAAATLAHLLVSSVRRRRQELAVLKTMGFDRSQVRRAVAWQATSLAMIATCLGVPVGVAAGRLAWNLIAGGLGTVPQPVTRCQHCWRCFRRPCCWRTSWLRSRPRWPPGSRPPRPCTASKWGSRTSARVIRRRGLWRRLRGSRRRQPPAGGTPQGHLRPWSDRRRGSSRH